jgi:hypothetical protein
MSKIELLEMILDEIDEAGQNSAQEIVEKHLQDLIDLEYVQLGIMEYERELE